MYFCYGWRRKTQSNHGGLEWVLSILYTVYRIRHTPYWFDDQAGLYRRKSVFSILYTVYCIPHTIYGLIPREVCEFRGNKYWVWTGSGAIGSSPATLEVTGSNPVSRTTPNIKESSLAWLWSGGSSIGRVAVGMLPLKVAGSIPAPCTVTKTKTVYYNECVTLKGRAL